MTDCCPNKKPNSKLDISFVDNLFGKSSCNTLINDSLIYGYLSLLLLMAFPSLLLIGGILNFIKIG